MARSREWQTLAAASLALLVLSSAQALMNNLQRTERKEDEQYMA